MQNPHSGRLLYSHKPRPLCLQMYKLQKSSFQICLYLNFFFFCQFSSHAHWNIWIIWWNQSDGIVSVFSRVFFSTNMLLPWCLRCEDHETNLQLRSIWCLMTSLKGPSSRHQLSVSWKTSSFSEIKNSFFLFFVSEQFFIPWTKDFNKMKTPTHHCVSVSAR